jgi:hypothetical protein
MIEHSLPCSTGSPSSNVCCHNLYVVLHNLALRCEGPECVSSTALPQLFHSQGILQVARIRAADHTASWIQWWRTRLQYGIFIASRLLAWLIPAAGLTARISHEPEYSKNTCNVFGVLLTINYTEWVNRESEVEQNYSYSSEARSHNIIKRTLHLLSLR